MANDSELINVFVEPGGFFVGNAAYRSRTLLGSCLSVALWHPQRRIGATTHFVLPERLASVRTLDARYGEEAMRQLLLELARLDIPPEQCQAKLFGGNVLWRPSAPANGQHPHGDAARRCDARTTSRSCPRARSRRLSSAGVRSCERAGVIAPARSRRRQPAPGHPPAV
jgi:chemotaxis protein CheD